MHRTSRLTATALAALLAGAPITVFAQPTSTGTPGTAPGSNMSGSSTANPGMGTTAPSSSIHSNNAQSSTTNMPSTQGYSNGQAGTGLEQQQLSQSTLENVQQQLQQQGFYRTGKIDGRWGPGTHQAVLNFQQSKGLQATGQLDQQTLEALGINKQGG